jgi:hypothetical protein
MVRPCLPAIVALFAACGRFGFAAVGGDGGGNGDGGIASGDGATIVANIAFLTSTQQVVGTLGSLAAADAIASAARVGGFASMDGRSPTPRRTSSRTGSPIRSLSTSSAIRTRPILSSRRTRLAPAPSCSAPPAAI